MFFFDGHALIPEYAALPEGDPVAGLMALLERGSERGNRNFVPAAAFLASSEREADGEQIALELSADFWSLPAGERYAAAAQIVHTLSTLEGGKELLLLDGTVPGEIVDGSFEPMAQPLTRELFADVTPWIEIVQPVAGSVIGHTVVVSVRSRSAELTAAFSAGGETLVEFEIEAGDSQQIKLDRTIEGPVTLTVATSGPQGTHEVNLPLVVAPGS